MIEIKKIIILLYFLGITLSIAAQNNQRFSLLMSNYYSNSFFSKNGRNQKGYYGLSGEWRIRFSQEKKQFQFGMGLAYQRIGFNEFNDFMTNSHQISHRHFVSVPFYITYNFNQYWYGNVQLSLDIPFRTSWVFFENGQKKSSGGSNHHLILNTGFSTGIALGRNILQKEKWTLFVEGNFKVFSIIAPFRDDEVFFLWEGETPYAIGLIMGIRF